MAIKQFIAKVLGFTRSRKSLIGSSLIKIKNLKKMRLALTGGLFAAIFLASFMHKMTFATSIGGVPVINITPQIQNVSVKTDVTVRIPLEHYTLSRGFGWFHSGADLAANIGEPIYPVMEGVIVLIENGWLGYGNRVIVSHGNGVTTLYGHMSKITTEVGKKVGINDKIGEVGSTGFSTGPHLHLELRQDDVPVDPAEILSEVKDH